MCSILVNRLFFPLCLAIVCGVSSEYIFAGVTYIDGSLDATLNTSAFNRNVRPSSKQLCYTLSKLLRFVSFLHCQLEVSAQLLGHLQALCGQIWRKKKGEGRPKCKRKTASCVISLPRSVYSCVTSNDDLWGAHRLGYKQGDQTNRSCGNEQNDFNVQGNIQ